MAADTTPSERLQRLQRVAWVAALALLLFSLLLIGSPAWPLVVFAWAGLLAASFALTVAARRAGGAE